MLTVTKLAAGTAAFARLHEHHRECHGHGAARQPERKILALAFDGSALGRRGQQEAAKGFRRLKAYKQLPILQAALAVRKARTTSSNAHLAQTTKAA
jgi:hypothetical protein